ncbi:hypothetical protein GGR53DRAFT_239321 [Hypoxylon sp. FL1150]|nr:hypothetical protein GGR53DRAFT_239321 [Hypoxylon sp. FL1150]
MPLILPWAHIWGRWSWASPTMNLRFDVGHENAARTGEKMELVTGQRRRIRYGGMGCDVRLTLSGPVPVCMQ